MAPAGFVLRLEPGELSCVRQRESNEESAAAADAACGWRESTPMDCAESATSIATAACADVFQKSSDPPDGRNAPMSSYVDGVPHATDMAAMAVMDMIPLARQKTDLMTKPPRQLKHNGFIINYALAHVNTHLKKCVQKSMIFARFARKIDAGERFQRTPAAESVTVGNTESLNLAHPSGTNRKVSSGAAE